MRIDIGILIVWLEVNIFGQTILPEIFTCFWIFGCILWIIMFRMITWKKLMFVINPIGKGKDFM